MRCILMVSSLLLSAGGTIAAERPNILILMADNWVWPTAGALGDPVAPTPTFDALAARGVTFSHAFCSVPSCAPARAVFLTGKHAHRLGPGANLHGTLPAEHMVFPDLLEQAGYAVGYSGKGWGPGRIQESGRSRNPAGNKFDSFAEFLAATPPQQPFCFWFSSRDPHVPWTAGADLRDRLSLDRLRIPAYLPDEPAVRQDLAGYYAEVANFDRDCGQHLQLLRERGALDNTLVVMTGDNGWQMPRGLAHIYDSGTRVPLVVTGPPVVAGGRTTSAFVSFEDFAPTFLELAGVREHPACDGVSLLPLLRDASSTGRDRVYLERERHANVRRGDLSYPVRAVRTADWLYVRNLRPDRGPSGDAEFYFAVGPYGDVDASLTKELLLHEPRPERLEPFFQGIFGLRPGEELYDLRADPDQTHNLAGHPQHASTLQQLRADLSRWMEATQDPRIDPAEESFDRYPYFGTSRPQARPARSDARE